MHAREMFGRLLARIRWYPDATGPTAAFPVRVVTGKTTAGIDIAVTKGGSISGRVISAATRRPLRGLYVAVVDFNADDPENLNLVNDGFTDRAGRYRIGGLGGKGTYDVVFGFGGPGATAAALVRTGRDQHRAFPVSGRGIVGFSLTGPGGGYQMPGLTPGTYKVLFAACTPGPVPGMPGQAPQWYRGRGLRRTATLVRIRPGQRTAGIGAHLAADGTLSGTVTTTGNAPLGGICVTAVPTGAAFPGSGAVAAITTSAGTYAIGDLAPGAYKVVFAPGCGTTGYASQWWRDASSQSAAAVITLRPGAARTGIDAALSVA